jgi:NADH-quinone oxidoreductase subunit I
MVSRIGGAARRLWSAVDGFQALGSMQDNTGRTGYFHNIWRTFYTILVGMRVSLKYCFGKTVTVQYPDVPPVLQPRFRGFHYYEIERCIACDQCARACPVDCIYIEKTAPRKLDKERGVAVGGAMERYAVDYAKCLFCGLCVETCPTSCIHMGNIHDMSAYTREDMIAEFTDLAREGWQTPKPLWMRKEGAAPWVRERAQAWDSFAYSEDGLSSDPAARRQAMRDALDPEKMAVKKEKKEAKKASD